MKHKTAADIRLADIKINWGGTQSSLRNQLLKFVKLKFDSKVIAKIQGQRYWINALADTGVISHQERDKLHERLQSNVTDHLISENKNSAWS